MDEKSPLHLRVLHLLLFVGSLAVSALRTEQVAQSNREIVAQRVDALSDRVARWTEQTVGQLEYGLRVARGAVISAGGEDIDQDTFGEYAASREHEREFPGSHGFGFVRRVERADEAAYLANMRLARPDFAIRELDAHPGARFVIETFEPLERNRVAIGLDIASEPHRYAAAVQATRSGKPVLTAPITLVQAISQPERGFLLLLPVYRRGPPAETAEAREAQAFGWTVAPVLIEEVLAHAGWLDRRFHLRLTDITDPARPIRFYGGTSAARAAAAPAQRSLEMFERRWQVEVEPTPYFVEQLNLPTPWREGLTTGGLGALLGLVLYLYLDRRRRDRQARLELARFSAIVKGADSAIIGQDSGGRVISWNPAAERLFGYGESEVLGRDIRELILTPGQAAQDKEALRQTGAGGSVTRALTERRRRDGAHVDVQIVESQTRDEHGEVVGVSSTIRDIWRHLAVENTFRELMELTSPYVGELFLDRAVEALNGLLKADLVFITQVIDDEPGRLRVIAAWERGSKRENWDFDIAGTPCELLYNPAAFSRGGVSLPGGSAVVQAGVEKAFPAALGSGLEGFIGLPLRNAVGELIGHMTALFVRPIGDERRDVLVEVGRLFAHRVEAELYRLGVEAQRDRAMAQMRVLNGTLEAEVAARTQDVRHVSAVQQAILANAGYALIACDREGRITEFNRAAERLFGYQAGEVLGRTAEFLHDPLEIDARARQLSDELGRPISPGGECLTVKASRGGPDEREWTCLRKDGTRMPVLVNISALHDDAGQVTGYIGVGVDLTERKRLERAVTAERDRFRTIFELAPSAILTVDSRGLIESINDRAEIVFGYPRAELVGRSIDMLIPPDRPDGHGEYLVSGNDAPPVIGRAVGVRHRDGREVPIDLRLSRFEGEDGFKLIAIATDRSEQQMLTESEQRWRTMANSLPQLVWTCAPDGAIDFFSRQFCDYAGVSDQFPLGDGGFDLIHPDDRGPVHQHWSECVRTVTELRTDFRLRRHDGVYRWFESRGVPLLDQQGQVLKWVGACTDIEERKQAEAQIRDLNAHLEQRIDQRTQLLEAARRDLRNILDALPMLIGYWDSRLRNRFANHAYQYWFGLDPARIPGMTMAEVLGPTLHPLILDHAQAALRGEEQIFEREICLPDGSIRCLSTQYLPDLVDGEVRGFYALAHDISEMRRAQVAAEAASAAKSTFLANMSHEIRTPMNAVLGMLQLLNKTRLDVSQQEYVGRAAAAGRTLMAILNDILDFSKIEADKLVLDQQLFGVDGLMREIGVMLSASRNGKPIEIVFDIDPDIPRQLVGDALRLQQILINLGGNALKFTERGEVLVSVRCGRITPDHVDLAFSVSDTGIGMSETQCKQVFEGFVQAEASTTRRYGGTGLGLAISQRLALLMGGELHVESRIGQGTTFRFMLGFDRPAIPEPPPAPMDQRLAGLRVLLVENNTTARGVISRLLNGFGWTVETWDHCSQALTQVATASDPGRRYDALLMSWPPDDSACSAALEARLGAPLIALTTAVDQAEPAGPAHAYPGGPLRYLVKPLTGSVLFDAVAETRLGDPSASPSREPMGNAGPLAGLRILVVEDNLTNQLVAEGLLSAAGAEVILASTGAAGVEWVRLTPQPFDILLMDIQMPDMDGFAATRLIRALPQGAGLPIVAMTANALNSDREACLAAGMNEHVGKPFELRQLTDVILRCCGRLGAGTSAPSPRMRADRVPSDTLLDAKGAQARLGGDAVIYREIVASFLKGAPPILQGLAAPGPEPDLSHLQRLAHTLKGLAGTVGAERLRALAAGAEQVLKREGIDGFRQQVLSDLADAGDDSFEALRSLLGQTAPAGLAPDRAGGVPIDAGLRELEDLLRASNGRALSLFAELRSAHGGVEPAGFRALGEVIDALDFVEAACLCRALRARLRSTEEPA